MSKERGQSFEDGGPGPADSDLTDDDFTDTVACPLCGEEVYADADRCPACGQWIVEDARTSARAGFWWWVALALAGAGLLLWIVL